MIVTSKKRSPIDNDLSALFIGSMILFVVGEIDFKVWILVFSLLVAWVVADVLISAFSGGGRGAGQIPVTGSRIRSKLRVYLAFIFGIIFSSLVSSYFSDFFVTNLLQVD